MQHEGVLHSRIAALDGTSLLVLDSVILEPGSELPGNKKQAGLRSKTWASGVQCDLALLNLEIINYLHSIKRIASFMRSASAGSASYISRKLLNSHLAGLST